MRGWLIPLLFLPGLAACAQTEPADGLDRELAVFRSEQEAYRVEELDARYREDRQRAGELTRGILALREEIRRLEADLATLEAEKGRLKEELDGKGHSAGD